MPRGPRDALLYLPSESGMISLIEPLHAVGDWKAIALEGKFGRRRADDALNKKRR